MATIKDVSARAGVSIKTVSRVVNGNAEVAPATRLRVQQAIHELDYRPSVLAKRLVSGKTSTVGVVIPHSAGYVFSHLYFNDVLRGVGEILGRHGLDLLLHLGRDDLPYAELFRQHRVDGLILLSIPVDDTLHHDLLDSEAPCVFTCRISVTDNPTHWVDADAETGMEQAVDHLVALGHRHIGFLAGPHNFVLARFQESGFRKAMKKHGLTVNDRWIQVGTDDYSFEAGQRMASELMSRHPRPTAVACRDDMTAIGAIRAIESLGLRVPGDVSIIGFDDVVLARYITPALTTVRQDGYQKGRVAASTLVEVMNGSIREHPRQVVLDTELIIRDSTGAASTAKR